ncbi:MAG: hypothetical protein PWQ10_608 [Patescibacteria group bacterium]|nr:hypothetical protein [Patescibacteria group bacterium]
MRIFFSWQSDITQNRAILQKAIHIALQDYDGHELETATRDMIGSVDIAKTILDKIDNADMLIADVSIINSNTNNERKMPNPNVMYELGYGVKSLGETNIVLVANKDITDDKDLPFDIRNRRMVYVSFTNKNAVNQIAAAIKDAINNSSSVMSKAPDLPHVSLNNPYASWAANYGGHGASFLVETTIDNFEGADNYILDAAIIGTNANGTDFRSEGFDIENSKTNSAYALKAGAIEELRFFLVSEKGNHRPMPDLDRDTVKFYLKFRSGGEVMLPIHIRQN